MAPHTEGGQGAAFLSGRVGFEDSPRTSTTASLKRFQQVLPARPLSHLARLPPSFPTLLLFPKDEVLLDGREKLPIPRGVCKTSRVIPTLGAVVGGTHVQK